MVPGPVQGNKTENRIPGLAVATRGQVGVAGGAGKKTSHCDGPGTEKAPILGGPGTYSLCISRPDPTFDPRVEVGGVMVYIPT